MASGAGRLLEPPPFADVPAAIADCDYVFATTARGRDLTKPVMTPERAMEHARALAAEGKRVGVLFGPERAGLENEDVALANAIVTVPVNPEFPSLNLAQCVLLMGYEWRRQTVTVPPEVMAAGADGFRQRDRGARSWAIISRNGWTRRASSFRPHKAPGMKLALRNMWARLNLTRADVQTLHGMLRQIAWKLGRSDRD